MFRLLPYLMVALVLPVQARAYQYDSDVWRRVLITEAMIDPLGTAIGLGQWFEIENPGTEALNLQGMVVVTASGSFHIISPSVERVLQPGERMVFGRNDDREVNGGAAVDYVYGGDVSLDPEDDALVLLQGSFLVDILSYGPHLMPVISGSSMSREPGAELSLDSSWCPARRTYGAFGNLGTPGAVNTWCDNDLDNWSEDEGDCNDEDAGIHPGAVEVCNGLDDDCDGKTDEDVTPAQECLSEGVCSGTMPTCMGEKGFSCIYGPDFEADETLCDGLDNDCDGETDEVAVPSGECLQMGICAGSVMLCGGNRGFVCGYPAGFEDMERSCDGLDNDCDGLTDEDLLLGESCETGKGICARSGQFVCATSGQGAVCDAEAGLPETERCGDGLDNDCDGVVDNGFPVGEVCTVGQGACQAFGKYRCAEDGLDVVCNGAVGLPGQELCEDGIDNDCDGETDESDCSWPQATGGSCGAASESSPGAILGLFLIVLAVGFRSRKHHSSRLDRT